MSMTKTAHDEATKAIAPIDARDSAMAFELGFAKTAQALGLTDEQYTAAYQAGLASLQTPAK